MPLPRTSRRSPLTRKEFDAVLREWCGEASDSELIGDSPDFGGKAWLHVLDLGRRFYLNADTTTAGVREYLNLLNLDPELEWHVVANQRGVMNKAAFGAGRRGVSKFYLYLADD